MPGQRPPRYTLPVIIFAQFTGTSLWFAGNAVLPDLQTAYGLPEGALGGLTSVVQLGFITGTLLYAGSAKVAYAMLLISGLLCLASPLLFQLPGWAFTALLCLWGFAVVGDSPQFSTLVAQNAPPESRGSALTIVNSIGFAVTIFSIQGLTYLSQTWGISNSLWILVFGPILGLTATRRLFREA